MFNDYDIWDTQQVTYHILITLQSGLSHIGEVTGNVSNLKTLKLLDLEGEPRQCFTYSGNALRNGILRRKGIASALDKLGLKVNPDTHHTLFAGGRIDGGTDSDMELDRKIRQLLPFLSVLGTAKPMGVFGHSKSQMVPGRLNVGSAYLVCYESLRYLYQQCPAILEYADKIGAIIDTEHHDIFTPPTEKQKQDRATAIAENIPFLRKHYKSWTQYIVVDQTTRRDSMQAPALQPYLKDKPLLTGDAEAKKKKSDQMIASDRLIMGGAKLYSRWDFNGTAIEEGFLYDALLAFAQSPYIGGKGNRGNGLVSMDVWYQTPTDKGHLLTIGKSEEVIAERVTNQLRAYHDYLNAYRGFLKEAKEAPMVRELLGAG